MKGRSHENDVFTPCGRSVHTGEKNGWTDGTARFHVHTHQGSQILHSFSWRFRKYKFHVTVIVAVTRFEVWVRIMGFREATALTQEIPIGSGSLSLGELGLFTSVRLGEKKDRRTWKFGVVSVTVKAVGFLIGS